MATLDANSIPQPRTLGYSKEDTLTNYAYFFGAPVSPEKLKDYSEHHALTCALNHRTLITPTVSNLTAHQFQQ